MPVAALDFFNKTLLQAQSLSFVGVSLKRFPTLAETGIPDCHPALKRVG
jgi:hypothetical protein